MPTADLRSIPGSLSRLTNDGSDACILDMSYIPDISTVVFDANNNGNRGEGQ
jgi:hypothetical protein